MTWFDWSKEAWRETPAVWVHRGGRDSELELPFIESGKIGLYWGIDQSLSSVSSWDDLVGIVGSAMPDVTNTQAIAGFASMVWSFVFAYRKGDLVIMPRRGTPNIAIGRITGDYQFDGSTDLQQLSHFRTIEWLNSEFPKRRLDDDIELRVASRKTIGRMHVNDGVSRVMKTLGGVNGHDQVSGLDNSSPTSDTEDLGLDVEELGIEQIAEYISRNFKSHAFTGLVAAVLQAQGFSTYVSPPGPDKGADILAGTGPLGLESPRLCVQVKSGEAPVDRMTVDQLIGTMQNFSAEQGLFVSWGGFNRGAAREIPSQWFNVRMWQRDDFIGELLSVFDELDEITKSKLPFKRIWTLAEEVDAS